MGAIAIQLIPVEKTNPSVKNGEDFVQVMKTPQNATELLKNACYDCHSNETRYPDYASIAPISWSIKRHVNEGREHLNFSVWETYNPDLKKGMLKNAISSLEHRTMPINAYVNFHPEAQLSEAERQYLAKYFKEVLNSVKN